MRWKFIIVIGLGCLAVHWLRSVQASKHPETANPRLVWTTDAAAAQARARSEHRTLLMDFTGSDWCGWCQRLDREVFSTPEFAAYANRKLVLLQVDFPRHHELSSGLVQQNQELAQRYSIAGFPTVVVLGPDGTEKGRLGYRPGGPRMWLGALEAIE